MTHDARRALRVPTHATAVPTEPERPQPWRVRNVSVTGAFLETSQAIPVGTELEVSLVFGAMMIRTRARVVRIQESGWGLPAGVGVEFTQYQGDSEQFLKTYVTATVESGSGSEA